MSIEHTLEQDLVAAMKAKDTDKLSVLRMIKAAVLNYKISKKRESITDDEVFEIIQKQTKQRRESLESFEKAGRQDLAAKEKKEIDILQTYLPAQLSDDEILKLAKQAIDRAQATTKSQIGLVMKELMPSVKGKADGKKVNEILNSLLS